MDTLPLSLNGYTDLPPGKIADVVTYFELTAPPPNMTRDAPSGLSVRHVVEPSVAWFRDIYRRIGEDWLWFGAAMMSDDQLATELAPPRNRILALARDDETIGLAELRFGDDGDVEIVTFGVVPGATGIGAAGLLMDAALTEAFRPGTGRVWLHTCSFDHPAATRFYLKRGFRAFKYAIEVVDDPRVAGLLPLTAAPHVPIVRPAKPA
jgi:GNAT superfamily N-acetyltransferase